MQHFHQAVEEHHPPALPHTPEVSPQPPHRAASSYKEEPMGSPYRQRHEDGDYTDNATTNVKQTTTKTTTTTPKPTTPAKTSSDKA